MRIGLIGDRGHQEYVFEGLKHRPEVTITAISMGTTEDDPGSLLSKCRQAGHDPTIYVHYQDLLCRGDLDVVSICGPMESHAEMSIEALQQGIHVLSEKPVALNIPDLNRLKQAHLEQPQLHFTAMMGLRYDPAFYTAWKAVRKGAVGEVRVLNAQKSYKLGKRPAFYHQRQTYGGTIPWVGSHAIDWIYWFSGVPFLSVSALHSSKNNDLNGDLEVSALCQFQLANEIFASVSLDYFRPGFAKTHGDDRLRVVGTSGVIEVRFGQVFVTNDLTGEEESVSVHCDRQIFSDFLAVIEGNSQPILTANDAFIVTEACLLSRQSADELKPIDFRSIS